MRGERRGDLRREGREGGVVHAARAREVHVEDLLDAARIGGEEHHAVAEADGFADVVGDEHDGLLALREDFLDVTVELLAREGVERRERLIHQQHARVGGERTGEGDALAHPPGEFVRAGLFLVTEADEVQVVAGGLEALGLGEVRLEAEAEEDVLQGIEPREERILLEHDEAIPARGRHRLIPEADLAFVGMLQTGQQAQQGGLTATGRTDNDEELPFPDVQGDLLQGRDLASRPVETLGDVAQGQGRGGGGFVVERAHGAFQG